MTETYPTISVCHSCYCCSSLPHLDSVALLAILGVGWLRAELVTLLTGVVEQQHNLGIIIIVIIIIIIIILIIIIIIIIIIITIIIIVIEEKITKKKYSLVGYRSSRIRAQENISQMLKNVFFVARGLICCLKLIFLVQIELCNNLKLLSFFCSCTLISYIKTRPYLVIIFY